MLCHICFGAAAADEKTLKIARPREYRTDFYEWISQNTYCLSAALEEKYRKVVLSHREHCRETRRRINFIPKKNWRVRSQQQGKVKPTRRKIHNYFIKEF